MLKLRAIINLMLANRFCLFTDYGNGLDKISVNFRVGDAESASGYLLDRITDTLACEEAVLTVKDLINKK